VSTNTQIYLAYLEYKAVRESMGIEVMSFLKFRGVVGCYLRSIHHQLGTR
jgi:hypothetical protein